MPVALDPFGADSDSPAGKAWISGVKDPLGGGGGGVAGGGVAAGGGGGGVVEGGGEVVEGGGDGGALPAAVTVAVTGMRQVVDTPGPDCPM